MTTATSRRQPELTRQTVVVIGGGADIGLQTARGTRSRDPANPAALGRLFGDPPDQSDHVMATAAVPRSVEPGWLP
jgi:hypothetical protein